MILRQKLQYGVNGYWDGGNKMRFSKRHYEVIAKEIREKNPKDKESFINLLANLFEGDNERFNKERFLKACNGGENEA